MSYRTDDQICVRQKHCLYSPAAAKEVQQQCYLLKHIDALDSNKYIALEVKSFHDLHSLHDTVSLGIRVFRHQAGRTPCHDLAYHTAGTSSQSFQYL